MNFNHYYTNEELESVLKNWAASYPNLISLSQIGTSYEKRPIWLVTLTNQQIGSDRNKPAVWLDANIHATELAGTTTVLYFLQHVLENYGTDNRVTRQIDTVTFYVVPRINPDGAAAAMDSNPRYLRSGVRPYPWEEMDEGLHVQDIDGDSQILQMRIPDPNGDWKTSDQDARFMVKRSPEDFEGEFYRLLPEGLVKNYDGYQIKVARPIAGLDFNRNFPFEWRPENEQQGAGPFPTSEPEIDAVVRFVADHKNISIALTFHTFSRALLRPFSTKADESMDPADLELYKTIGAIGTRITGYRNVSTFHDFTYHPKYVSTGAFDDWAYDQLGAFAFTVELWDLPTEAGIKDRSLIHWFSKHPVEEDLQILKWVDENVGPDGYVQWRPFYHPQLGEVELGGWNTMFTWRNPPPALMEKEAERHTPFILSLADLLPQVSLHTLEAKQLNEKTWSITLVVENNGYLATYTSQQTKNRLIARPMVAELTLAVGKILVGKERTEIGHLEGRSNKEGVSSVFGLSPTDNRGIVHWVVECPKGSTINIAVLSERGGKVSRSLILG
ncbi:MAG: carboxypeptidase [Anaerolineaceae bacterium]|nr:carboxypeptidase [Anaerolineaceae bacterium]